MNSDQPLLSYASMLSDVKRMQEEREAWTSYKERLLNELAPMRELSHKTMIAVAGGALALSITFWGNVIDATRLFVPNYLFWSWVCLALSLLFAMAHLILGIQMRDRTVKRIAQGKQEGIATDNDRIERYTGKITFINFALLFLGFVLMGVFLNQNIKGKIADEQISTAATTAASSVTTAGSTSGEKGLDTSSRTAAASSDFAIERVNTEKVAEILNSLGLVGYSRDIIVATPEQIDEQRNRIGSVLYNAIPESKVLYDGTSREK